MVRSIRKFLFIFAGIFLLSGQVFSQTVQSKEVARKVLALYKGSEKRTEEVNEIYQLAQLPLNNLGLVVAYADAEKNLPSLDELKTYRGILTWFITDQMKHAHRYRKWLNMVLKKTQLRVVVLGHFGAYREFGRDITASDFREMNTLLQELGLKSGLQNWNGEGVEIVRKDSAFFDYERTLRSDELDYFYDIHSVSPKNRVLLTLKRNGIVNDAAVLFPRGGFIQNGAIYKLHEAIGRKQFYVNPFRFFASAFDAASLPVVDLNTLGGKRLAFIHLDGDGFSIISKIDHWHTCAELFKDWVLKKFRLPFSISIIEGEIDPVFLGKKQRVQLAREEFRLPNVEAASHGLAHPFDWRTGKLELDSIPNYRFDPEMEIVHSVNYIRGNLLPPGKSTRLFFWTGMCNPTAEQIKIARVNNILQINGGGGRLDANYPSISDFYPPYAQVGNEIRINARASNEYEFTNLWQPPYDGFKHLIETLKFSEFGFRRVPADIYFHYYSMEVKPSWNALREVLNFARHQDWNFVRTSQYVQMVQDFLTARIFSDGKDTFLIHSRGFARTIRFRNETRSVNLVESRNVLGFTHEVGDLLVHLNAEKDHRIVLGKAEMQVPCLSEFNRPVDFMRIGGDSIKIWANGYGQFRAKLKNLPAKRVFELVNLTGLTADQYKLGAVLNLKKLRAQGELSGGTFRSSADGTLNFRAFLKNRSVLILRPANSFHLAADRIKLWALAVVLVGFAAFQLQTLRKRVKD